MTWSTFCEIIKKNFEKGSFCFSKQIASNPKAVIFVTVTASLLSTLGFIRFYDLNRIDKLYIPQHSQSMKNLKRASRYFLLNPRVEQFILKFKDDKSVINDELFQQSLLIHQAIQNIKDYTKICVKNTLQQCLVMSPLDLFFYNETAIQNVSHVVNQAYLNNQMILSNGRTPKYTYSSWFGYMQVEDINKTVQVDATAIRFQYFLIEPNNHELFEKEMQWETEYLKLMEKFRAELRNKGYDLLYLAQRSTSDSVLQSSEADIKLVPVSLVLMIIFCTITLAKFRNPINGHFILGIGGIGTLILGIAAAFGFVMLTGQPYIGFAGVLPFLVVGVGIDNIFIIIHCFDREKQDLATPLRIARTMKHVGSSITMTTVTDLVAFAVSTITDFPAIRYFCLYVTVSITFCFILVVTLFLALLALDAKRVCQKRKDFLPCIVWNTDTDQDSNKEHSDKEKSIQIIRWYGSFLMRPIVRLSIIVIYLLLLVISIWGALRIDQSFDPLNLGLEDTTYGEFLKYRNDAFPTSFEISIIIDTPVDYTNSAIQRKYADVSLIPQQNEFVKNESMNWMLNFLQWSKANRKGLNETNFYVLLHQFLLEERYFYPDIVFHKKGKILASRLIAFSSNREESGHRKKEMLSLRQDLKQKAKLPVYAIALQYIYIEQFVIMLRDTIRNLGISSGIILLITFPYLTNVIATFFVFCGFASLIFELLGIMYIWSVSLNSISMIIIVMAIGFSVDYSAHIAHAYVTSEKGTKEEKALDALQTMGISVFMGGTSTFIGVLATAFATSKIFHIFFKMMFGIVTLGLLHGLVFLPVLLATFCEAKRKVVPAKVVEGINNEAAEKSEQT